MNALALLAVLTGSLSMAMLFRWLKLPMWPLTGGLVGSAAVNMGFGLEAEVPAAFVLGAQLLIGTAIGASIGPDIFRQFARFLAPGVLAVVAVLALGVLFGWLFGVWGLLQPAESMLALMPGGVGEMVAAAIALDLDGAVVIGAHMVRLFTVVWSLPLILWAAERMYKRWFQQPGGEQEGPATG